MNRFKLPIEEIIDYNILHRQHGGIERIHEKKKHNFHGIKCLA